MSSLHLPEMQQWRSRTRELVGRRGSKTKPTDYPFLVFHGIRSMQLVSSIVVLGIMSDFLYQLHNEGFGSPWTFILLLTVSVFTLLSLTGTIVQHCYYGLNPKLNFGLNGGLLVLWILGWSLLTWWASGTLGHVCTIERWNSELGVMVCRTYKALFAFSLFGLLSTAAAFALDFSVLRRTKAQGKYSQMDDNGAIDRKGNGFADRGDYFSGELHPVASGMEPLRSPSRARSSGNSPGGRVLLEESSYDAFRAGSPALAARKGASNGSSRDGYAALEPERYDEEPFEGPGYAGTPRFLRG